MPTLKEMLKDLPSMATNNKNDSDLMANAEYIRKSSSLISEALKKGFDVLQLDNGDVVTTGTKTIVTTYTWDEKKSKMVKASARAKKGKKSDD